MSFGLHRDTKLHPEQHGVDSYTLLCVEVLYTFAMMGKRLNFYGRHRLRNRRRVGEARSMNLPNVELTGNGIPMVMWVLGACPRDVFNGDKTEIVLGFQAWKTLAFVRTPGVKKDNDWTILLFCCNGTGNEKLKACIIAKPALPRCLGLTRSLNAFGPSKHVHDFSEPAAYMIRTLKHLVATSSCIVGACKPHDISVGGHLLSPRLHIRGVDGAHDPQHLVHRCASHMAHVLTAYLHFGRATPRSGSHLLCVGSVSQMVHEVDPHPHDNEPILNFLSSSDEAESPWRHTPTGRDIRGVSVGTRLKQLGTR